MKSARRVYRQKAVKYRRYNHSLLWMSWLQHTLAFFARPLMLLGVVNFIGFQAVGISFDIIWQIMGHLKDLHLVVIGTVSEFGATMDFLKNIHFELPIFVLLVLVLDNVMGIIAALTAPASRNIKYFVFLSFRVVDMTRDLLELRSDYGFFRF